MATTVQTGDLAFTGFGEADMQFTSPSGDARLQPSSAPNCGSGVDGIVALPTSGRVAVVGANAPSFPTTGVGLYQTSFSVFIDSAAGADGFPGFSIAADDAGQFYGVKSTSPAHGRLFRYSSVGVQNGDFLLGHTLPTTCGVNGAGTIGYYSLAFPNDDTVYAWDLTGDTDLGTFKTRASFQIAHNAILSLSNGDVLVGWQKTGDDGDIIHYNAAGSVLHTYTLTGTHPAPNVLTPGLTAATIWVSYYNEDVMTSSGVTVSELTLGTGDVVNTFDPDDGDFQFDGPFCVVRSAVNPPPAPTTTYPTVRERVFALPFESNLILFLERIEFLIQAGEGLVTGQGSDPVVAVWFSKDGGKTYGNGYTVRPGKMGEYDKRAYLNRLGRARNWVCKIRVSDPVFWAFLDCYVDMSEGTS